MSFFTFYQPDHRPQRPRRSLARTAAIVAGGTGLAYGGLKVGRAAGAVEHAVKEIAPAATAAARHAADLTAGAQAGKGKLLRRALGFSTTSLRKDAAQTIALTAGKPSVAADRYRKQIKETDAGRAAQGYHRSAAAGAVLGLALRKAGVTRGQAAGLGALGGVAAQAVARSASAGTKDNFGERSPGGKKIDAAPSLLLGGAAGIAAHRRIATKGGLTHTVARAGKSLLKHLFSTGKPEISFAGGQLTRALRARSVLHGGALAGGIAAADALTSAAFPEPNQSRTDAAAKGLAKGTVYGTGLAVAEPALLSALKQAVRSRKLALSAQARSIAFGGRDQMRDERNRFVDPLSPEAIGNPIAHGQLLRSAYNRAGIIHKVASRSARLTRDAVDVAHGRPSTGRKREWEKSWFHNALGKAAIAAGVIAHVGALRKSPAYRARYTAGMQKVRSTGNRVMADLFPMSARIRELRFDATQGDWDIRDARGRSARVFAPGAQRRMRREKKMHERVSFIRKAAVIGALAAAAGGTGVGYRLGLKKGLRRVSPGAAPAASNIIPLPKLG